MQVGCVCVLLVFLNCLAPWKVGPTVWGKMKRFSLFPANYSELVQYTHTVIHTNTCPLHWHIHMWWKPSAEIDKGSVSSVCAGSALSTPVLCHVLAHVCFYKWFQMRASECPCWFPYVCVCLLSWVEFHHSLVVFMVHRATAGTHTKVFTTLS